MAKPKGKGKAAARTYQSYSFVMWVLLLLAIVLSFLIFTSFRPQLF